MGTRDWYHKHFPDNCMDCLDDDGNIFMTSHRAECDELQDVFRKAIEEAREQGFVEGYDAGRAAQEMDPDRQRAGF